MNCREFTEFLHDYLLGGLLAEVRAEFDRHLAECPWCVAYPREPRSPRPRTLRLPATRPKSLSGPSFAPVLGTRDLPPVNAPHGPPSIPSGRPKPSHWFPMVGESAVTVLPAWHPN
jgi:anti-sigma factor RsiW